MTPAPISVERLRELHAVAFQWPPRNLDKFADAMHEALPALLHQLAERDAEVERLRIDLGREQHEHNRTKDALASATETWYDAETGTTWDVPTAWAYAQACRVREKQRAEIDEMRDGFAEASRYASDAATSKLRAEAAERAREEACKLLQECEGNLYHPHAPSQISALEDRVAAFLAASGGR